MKNTSIDPKQYQISLTLDDRCILVQGVTNRTTCSDVIEMVLKKFPFYTKKRDVPSLKVFESTRGEETLLSGKKKILKVIRSWNSSKQGEFVMRRISVVQRNKTSEARRTKIERVEPEGCETHCNPAYQSRATSSNLYCAKTKAISNPQPNDLIVHGNFFDNSKIGNKKRIFSYSDSNWDYPEPLLKRMFVDIGCKSLCGANMSRNVTGQSTAITNFTDRRNTTMGVQANEIKYAVKKTLKSGNITPVENKSETTDVWDNRNKTYTNSVDNHQKLAQSIHNQIASMDQRKGKEAILNRYFADYLRYQSPTLPSTYRRHGDGAEYNDNDTLRLGDGSSFSSYYPKSPVNSPHYNSFCSDTCSDNTSDSGNGDHEFDVAFIDDKNLDSELETAFIEDKDDKVKRLVDYSLTESDISAIEYDSEHELSRISSVSDFVKSVFTDNLVENEDDELDSFMKTKLSDEISDEGLSSLGSDFEN